MRRRDRAFTMVEVMTSIVVFITAAAGLVAFQHAIMRSNVSANDVSAATNIGQFWLERARLESLMWTTTDGSELAAARTPLLVAQQPNLTTTGGTTGWAWLPAGGVRTAIGSPLNRHLEVWPGPLGSSTDYGEFCVQYRLTTLMPGEVLRIEVRVMWFKQGTGARPAPAAVWTCPGAGMLAGVDPDLRLVNTVQFASTLWRNQVQ